MSFIPFTEAGKDKPAASKSQQVDILQMFRSSPLYRALLKKRKGGGKLLVQHDATFVANMVEQADNWIDNEDRSTADFPSTVLAKLVDIGLDRAILGADGNGPKVTLYLSDRIGKYYKEVPTFLSKFAETSLESSPDGNGAGMYVFQVQEKDGNDLGAYMRNLMADLRDADPKNEPLDDNQQV